MAHLTTQLLAYARGGKYQPRTLLLNEFIRDTLPLIQPTMGDAVHIETDIADYVWGVRADTAQMQMVLSAILSNASEAMEGSGQIHVRCRNDRIGKGSEEDRPIPTPGPYVRLTIQDDGQGMKKEVLDRVFEPFFTTKFQGRGLGLAAVYGIVTNHGGCITIDSKRGKGTRVDIFLPAVEVDEKTVPAEKESSGPSTGTVLIVEDEELVMEVNSGLLRRLGHRVLEARTGREALRIADSHEGNIDVVLLDIVLPDMGGGELYSRLMKARPGLKVVVCSGYALDGPARVVLDAGADDFLQKPFSMASLSDALQKLMPSNSG
jgi:CheY-like chemotaxis protein